MVPCCSYTNGMRYQSSKKIIGEGIGRESRGGEHPRLVGPVAHYISANIRYKPTIDYQGRFE